MDVIHGYETMFPIPLALSCSWDTEAMKKVGEVFMHTARTSYSYCPDFSRSTSSRVRNRHAPRLRFFFVRPA